MILYTYEKQISQFKNFELDFYLGISNPLAEWINLNIGTKTFCDHPKVFFEFSCLRVIYFNVTFYDSRHYEEIYEKNL